jgi:hypothetical protein
MIVVGYEGDFSQCSASSVLFLWKNWQYYFRLANRYISCEATSRLAWEGRGLGAVGEWYLTQHKTSPEYGLLHFHNYFQFLGALAKIQTIFQYARVADGRIWYCGGGFGSANGVLRLGLPLGSFALPSIGRTGGKVAARVTKNPGWLDERCGFEARALYEEYVAEESLWLSGSRETQKYFDGHQLRAVQIYEGSFGAEFESRGKAVASELGSVMDGLTSRFDPTLLKVAVKSLDYGVPGIALIALRDFMRQHNIDKGGSTLRWRNPLRRSARMIRDAGGRLRYYNDGPHMSKAEVDAVVDGVTVVRAALDPAKA